MEIKALRVGMGCSDEGVWCILDPMGQFPVTELDDIEFLQRLACPHSNSYILKFTSYEQAGNLLKFPFDFMEDKRVQSFMEVWETTENLQY